MTDFGGKNANILTYRDIQIKGHLNKLLDVADFHTHSWLKQRNPTSTPFSPIPLLLLDERTDQ